MPIRVPPLARVTEGVAEASCSLALILVPLYTDGAMDSPFDGAKYHLLISLVWVIGSAALAGALLGSRQSLERFLQRPLVVLALLYVGFLGLSTALSVDSGASLWGGLRYQGFTAHLCYIVVFLAVARHSNKDRILWAIAVAGALVGAIAMGNKWGFTDRVGGTLGSPVFLGQYLLFGLFVTGELIRRGYVVPAGLAMLLQAGGFLSALGRGAALGLVAGLLALTKGARWSLPLLLGLTIVGVGIFGPPESLQVRFEVWGATMQALDEAPGHRLIIGHGPETMELVIPWGGTRTYADRAHNVPLQVLFEGGLVALLLYLAIWGQALLSALRQRWLVGLLVALFVESLLGIRTASSQVTLWALLGTLIVEEDEPCTKRPVTYIPSSTW